MHRKRSFSKFMASRMSGSVLPAVCWHAGFHTSTSEAASGSTSPQHEQEEASPSCWEELRRRDEVAADKNFDNFVNANADGVH